MGWIIAIIIIILIAASGDKNKSTGSANNAKDRQIDQYTKGLIDRYISLWHTTPKSPEIESQLNKTVDDLIDRFVSCNRSPECNMESRAIIMAFCEHPYPYFGTKYPQFRRKSVDDIIPELIHNPCYR